MDILFGTGIDTVSCLLDAAEDAGIFTRKGSWYSYEGKNISQVCELTATPLFLASKVREYPESYRGVWGGRGMKLPRPWAMGHLSN